MRSRWAAIGAAVAVTVGGGGLLVVNAASSVSSSVVTIDPVRILDTRTDVGLAGPFVSAVSQKLQVTGSVATSTGTQAPVPVGATGVLLNVTVVGPSAAGFLSVRPGDASGAPSTSSLNFRAGDIVPNAVQVGLPTGGANAGKIDITYDAFGQAGPTTEVLIDVVGYTTQVDAYTKAQADNRFLEQDQPIVLSYPGGEFGTWGSYSPTLLYPSGHLTTATGDGQVALGLTAPASVGGTQYRVSTVEWCLGEQASSGAYVTSALIYHDAPGALNTPRAVAVFNATDRSNAGCYSLTVPPLSARGYSLVLQLDGQGNTSVVGISLSNVKATWVPA